MLAFRSDWASFTRDIRKPAQAVDALSLRARGALQVGAGGVRSKAVRTVDTEGGEPRLPFELLLEVIIHCEEDTATLATLARCSKALNEVVSPVLWSPFKVDFSSLSSSQQSQSKAAPEVTAWTVLSALESAHNFSRCARKGRSSTRSQITRIHIATHLPSARDAPKLRQGLTGNTQALERLVDKAMLQVPVADLGRIRFKRVADSLINGILFAYLFSSLPVQANITSLSLSWAHLDPSEIALSFACFSSARHLSLSGIRWVPGKFEEGVKALVAAFGRLESWDMGFEVIELAEGASWKKTIVNQLLPALEARSPRLPLHSLALSVQLHSADSSSVGPSPPIDQETLDALFGKATPGLRKLRLTDEWVGENEERAGAWENRWERNGNADGVSGEAEELRFSSKQVSP